jgi:hypothetical protein
MLRPIVSVGRILSPSSPFLLFAGTRLNASPGPPSARYASSLKVGVSKPRPNDAYACTVSVARHMRPATGVVAA